MAATTSLLELNPLKWTQLRPHSRLFPHRTVKFSTSLNNLHTFQRSLNFTGVKCFLAPKKKESLSISRPNTDGFFDPLEILTNTILKAIQALKKPAVIAVMLGVLLTYDPNLAFAASGGRMGGRSFSSHSSSSSRSYSVEPRISFSAPYYAPSPFGGGGGGLYVGPAVGVGVGAGSSLFLIMVGFAAFVLVSGFLSDRSDGSVLSATEKTSVIKLQVWN